MTIAELMAKLKEISGNLVAEVERGSDMSRERLAGGLKALADVVSDPSVQGYAETPELTRQVEQLRKDLDGAQGKLLEVERAGLRVRGGQVIVPGGREARLEMLADGRCFASDEQARRFGAWAITAACSPRPDRLAELPQRTREIAKDVAGSIVKVGDIDPGVAGSGAELVSNEFVAELIRNVEAVGTIFPLCRRVPLGTMGSTTYPKRTGGLTYYWVDAAAEITRSGATFGTVPLTPKKIATLTGVPNEMFRDPGLLVALGQFIGVEAVHAISDGIDNALVNGDGTGTYGGFTGILNQGTIPTSSAAATHTSVPVLVGADISKAVGALTSYALPNARWAMSNGVKGYLRALKDSNGNPLYLRGDAREPSLIDGYPFTLGTRMPASSVGTAAAYAVFADFRLLYYVGMIQSIRIDTSEGVYFTSDMTGVRGLAHVAVAMADANAGVIAKTAGE